MEPRTILSTRTTPEVAARIDHIAERESRTRSQVIERLIGVGLVYYVADTAAGAAPPEEPTPAAKRSPRATTNRKGR